MKSLSAFAIVKLTMGELISGCNNISGIVFNQVLRYKFREVKFSQNQGHKTVTVLVTHNIIYTFNGFPHIRSTMLFFKIIEVFCRLLLGSSNIFLRLFFYFCLFL